MGKTMRYRGGMENKEVLGFEVTDRSVKAIAGLFGWQGKGKRSAWAYIENIEWVTVQVRMRNGTLKSTGSIVG